MGVSLSFYAVFVLVVLGVSEAHLTDTLYGFMGLGRGYLSHGVLEVT